MIHGEQKYRTEYEIQDAEYDKAVEMLYNRLDVHYGGNNEETQDQ